MTTDADTIDLPRILLPRTPSTSPRAAGHGPDRLARRLKTCTRPPAPVRTSPAPARLPAHRLARARAPGPGPAASLGAASVNTVSCAAFHRV